MTLFLHLSLHGLPVDDPREFGLSLQQPHHPSVDLTSDTVGFLFAFHLDLIWSPSSDPLCAPSCRFLLMSSSSHGCCFFRLFGRRRRFVVVVSGFARSGLRRRAMSALRRSHAQGRSTVNGSWCASMTWDRHPRAKRERDPSRSQEGRLDLMKCHTTTLRKEEGQAVLGFCTLQEKVSFRKSGSELPH